MKLSIQQTAIGTRRLDKTFELARKAGADGIGISIRTMRDVIDMGRRDYAQNLIDLARKHELEIVNIHLDCLNLGPSLIGEPKDISGGKAVVRMAMWIAHEAGIPTVVVPFFGKNMIEFDHELVRAANALTELAEEAWQMQVVIGIESNLNSQRLEELLVNSEWVKAVVNTARVRIRRLDIASLIRDLGPSRVAQVQAQDVVLIKGTPPQFDVRLGRGDVDFGTVVRALRIVGYDGWLNIDVPPGDEDGVIAAANVAFMRGVLAGKDWLASKMTRMTKSRAFDEELVGA